MPTDVMMPQMGESVAEGTIVRWIKGVGDVVDKDEPLFEISTDKVDAEIPSPEGGVLLEIRVNEGETVPVHTVVAIIGEAGTHPAPVPAGAATPPPDAASPRPDATSPRPNAPIDAPGAAADSSAASGRGDTGRVSPAVRALAREHGVDVGQIAGTGAGGRVTKGDVEAYVARRRASAEGHEPAVRIEPLSVMRRKIAEHMVASVRTSPHVYSGYEVDFGRIEELRAAKKAAYEADGARLTYTAFIAKATVDAIREFPILNASLDGEHIVYKRDVNLGIAVALEQGLVVPVIRGADRRDMRGLCRAIQDLAHRARTKQLNPDEVQDGTFTITNPGIFGGLFGLPILSQPQAAILAVGSIEKRPVVVDDRVVARPTCLLTLGYDHRLIDGADAGRFLLSLKQRLQRFDEALL